MGMREPLWKQGDFTAACLSSQTIAGKILVFPMLVLHRKKNLFEMTMIPKSYIASDTKVL
jgi:hypothetical protein